MAERHPRDARLLSALRRLITEAEEAERDVLAGRPIIQIDVLGATSATAVRELGAYIERSAGDG